MKIREFEDVDEYGNIIAPPWVGAELCKPIEVNVLASLRDVLSRLSDSWKINYRIANGVEPIAAITSVAYAEPIIKHMNERSPLLNYSPLIEVIDETSLKRKRMLRQRCGR